MKLLLEYCDVSEIFLCIQCYSMVNNFLGLLYLHVGSVLEKCQQNTRWGNAQNGVAGILKHLGQTAKA